MIFNADILPFMQELPRLKYSFLQNVLKLDFCDALKAEISSLELPKAPLVYGKTKQDFNYKMFNASQLNSKLMADLIIEYTELYNRVSDALNFCQTNLNVAINYYKPDGLIEAHYDESKYRNLIAVFTIGGSSPFSIHSDRQTKTRTFNLEKGSLMLLAAPRSAEEKNIRPLHSVGPCLTERYAIVFRHEVSNG